MSETHKILGDMIIVTGRSDKENAKIKKALIRSIVNGHPELNPTDAELRKLQKRQAKAAAK
jgi:hypothetical protein